VKLVAIRHQFRSVRHESSSPVQVLVRLRRLSRTTELQCSPFGETFRVADSTTSQTLDRGNHQSQKCPHRSGASSRGSSSAPQLPSQLIESAEDRQRYRRFLGKVVRQIRDSQPIWGPSPNCWMPASVMMRSRGMSLGWGWMVSRRESSKPTPMLRGRGWRAARVMSK
jgi:hypothetical protein